MTLVVDASVLVEALTNRDEAGRWARQALQLDGIVSAHHAPLEVANVLRRLESTGEVSPDLAAIANVELSAMRLDLYPFQPYADRVWQLRHSVTIQDGWYVALAESLGAPLATVDLRLTRAPGPQCSFLTPTASI